MIRRLRRRHLIFGTTVLALAPVGLVIGILSRPAVPRRVELPVAEPGAALVRVPGLPVEAGGFGRTADSIVLVARSTASLAWPNPLLYWSPAPPVGDSLPDGAVFIATLSRRAARAAFVRTRLAVGGSLLIVDGARRRVVRTAPAPPGLVEAPR
jgi:hypothetical protein